MAQILTRTADLSAGTGRELYGIAVPFGQIAEVRDGFGQSYRESFAPGSMTRTLQERSAKLRLYVGHDTRKMPVAVLSNAEERADGLHVSFELAKTAAADEVLELARAGAVDFSVGFSPVRQRNDNGVTVRTEVILREISVVGMPAYPGATVQGVRSAQNNPTLSVAEARNRLALIALY
ncbi:HK97 family phage prohead protease [Rhodococcus sp. PvR044]|uniref:HK97 family phage prohead protease n=1 Tax=Rhodococcus sp. PvR044 TaxID=3156402 RepID=UPI0033928179